MGATKVRVNLIHTQCVILSHSSKIYAAEAMSKTGEDKETKSPLPHDCQAQRNP